MKKKQNKITQRNATQQHNTTQHNTTQYSITQAHSRDFSLGGGGVLTQRTRTK